MTKWPLYTTAGIAVIAGAGFLLAEPAKRYFMTSAGAMIAPTIEELRSTNQSLRAAITERPIVSVPSPLRASDLSANQILIDGVLARYEVRGPLPVRLLANVPGATEMRVGNTRQEVALSDWRPYAAESRWYIRTGPGQRRVFAEFRVGDDVFATSALVPEHNEAAGFAYDFPIESGNRFDPYDESTLIWLQNFETGHGLWASYDYHGGQHWNPNLFYPASWSASGGADGGYIWTDDSRWRIDTPEEPSSILALQVYPNFLRPMEGGHRTIDVANATASFDIKGRDLDLKGGSAHFFVNVPGGGRWNVTAPVEITEEWQSYSIDLASAEWTQSWATSEQTDAPLDLSHIVDFGIKFIGFDGEPTGVLALDNVRIEASP